MKFSKYHALGNDYIVLDPPSFGEPLNEQNVRRICHRNFGIGSDGILYGPLPSERAPFRLRILNPDGSEAEKSGNGLRIFCRYLFDQSLVKENTEFLVDTLGGIVRAKIFENGRIIQVDMGKVSFWSDEIPMAGRRREVLHENLSVLDRTFDVCCATIGNPHCVILLPQIDAELAKIYGPSIETHPVFPKRTNVQFLQVIDRANIRIEIWERGAGYTLASGSSSSASAAVARKLGLVDSSIRVHMPGGDLGIDINSDFTIRMTGPVVAVAQGTVAKDMFDAPLAPQLHVV